MLAGPNSGKCGVPGSFVWVYATDDQGEIPEDSNPISIRSGADWVNACHRYTYPEYVCHDTLGDWFKVVERPYIGYETVAINPPVWKGYEDEDA